MTTSAGLDYIRVRLLQCEPGDHVSRDELFDPYVIVNVLEAETEPGQSFIYSTCDGGAVKCM